MEGSSRSRSTVSKSCWLSAESARSSKRWWPESAVASATSVSCASTSATGCALVGVEQIGEENDRVELDRRGALAQRDGVERTRGRSKGAFDEAALVVPNVMVAAYANAGEAARHDSHRRGRGRLSLL